MSDSRHEFGGDWTELKLEAISAYSKFFTGAIGGIFDLWYIDPFAGTGERTSTEQSGGLFEQQPISMIERQYPGSAARALSVSPPFHHFRFGDSKRQHVRALRALVDQHPQIDAMVVPDDANSFIQGLFSKPPWSLPDRGAVRSRALVFLDPYGMEVKWDTLKVLADSKKADVWFLANLKAAIQQLSHDHSRMTEDKRASLCEYFGTPDWENEFYDNPSTSEDLFGNQTSNARRQVNKHEIAQFHKKCLERLFCYVSKPLSLRVGSVDDYFLLYCLSNNPTPRARDLIHKGASWVIERYTQASHHRSALQEAALQPSCSPRPTA